MIKNPIEAMLIDPVYPVNGEHSDFGIKHGQMIENACEVSGLDEMEESMDVQTALMLNIIDPLELEISETHGLKNELQAKVYELTRKLKTARELRRPGTPKLTATQKKNNARRRLLETERVEHLKAIKRLEKVVAVGKYEREASDPENALLAEKKRVIREKENTIRTLNAALRVHEKNALVFRKIATAAAALNTELRNAVTEIE